jgi:hypothetical protein
MLSGNSKFRSDYIFSTQDKEWFIDGLGVNNICDLMTYVESDDIRDAGIIFTPRFLFPISMSLHTGSSVVSGSY